MICEGIGGIDGSISRVQYLGCKIQVQDPGSMLKQISMVMSMQSISQRFVCTENGLPFFGDAWRRPCIAFFVQSITSFGSSA